jgi:leucyl/phenylalanyl-tRNA--protein transferase
MFARADDASKACLVHLVAHLNERRYRLLDCQQVTEHTKRFGAIWIPEGDYLERLDRALRVKRRFWP